VISEEVRRVEPGEPAFELLKQLKHEGYNVLVDFTAVDYSAWGQGAKGDASDDLKRAVPMETKDLVRPIALAPTTKTERPADPKSERFEVVWRLMKLDPETGLDKGRVALYAAVPEEPAVLRTASSLWPIADWLEREVWDMFGIRFVDRPDIKRLLLYEEFKGHPLRKDYPITRRQPLIGPAAGEPQGNPSFNHYEPTIKYE
jgi:NADH:ubiquinone oxidoreductase subunit C